LIGLRIDPRQIRALVQIAINAGQREIFEFVSSAMYLRNDMLDVKGRPRRAVDQLISHKKLKMIFVSFVPFCG